MIVAHNLQAMFGERQLNGNEKAKRASVEKLSTGFQVNRAADDAAGLSISEKMRNQIRGLNQAADNINDGISLIRTADGAMSELDAILHRGTELAVKGANDTLGPEDREAIQIEINEIIKEIDSVCEKTQFNNRYLLRGINDTPVGDPDQPVIVGGLPTWAHMDGPSAAGNYMAGTYTTPDGQPHPSSTISFADFTPAKIAESVGKGFYMTCCTCDNHYSVMFTDKATNNVTQSGQHYIYEVGLAGAQTPADVLQRIMDATNGQPAGHYTTLKVDGNNLIMYENRDNMMGSAQNGKVGMGVAYSEAPEMPTIGELNLQIGANAGENMKIKLPSMSSAKLGIGGVSVRSHELASDALDRFQNAVITVNAERSRMGAYENRLDHAYNNVQNYSENLTKAESQIRDTDMATEMATLAKSNILEQAAQAMLTQTSKSTQGVLSLLQG